MADFPPDLAGLSVGAEDLLGAVLEAATQPIWCLDADGVIRFANPAAVAALGYDSTGETFAGDRDSFARRDGSKIPVACVPVPGEPPEGRGAVVAFARRDAVPGAHESSLRRIAALVAGGAASADVFAAIAKEVGGVVGLPLVVVFRFEPEQTAATVIGAWSDGEHPFQTGTRWPLDGPTVLIKVLATGRPARIDDFTELPGRIPAAGRKSGLRAVAAAPIIVGGEIWGAMTAVAGQVALPAHVEDRLAEFTELVAAAISTTERQAHLARLAEEQAALRRVATLAVRGTSPEELFAAVVEEAGRVFPVENVALARYGSDGMTTTVAVSGPVADTFPVGGRWPLGGKNVTTAVFDTGRPARIDDYGDASGRLGVALRERGLASSVGAPIAVEGRLWGVMTVSATKHALPADTEARLASFTDLVATAIANIEARTEVGRLVDEQAALRRVATLVAEGAAPSEVFRTVTREVGILSGADLARMERYESGDSVIGVAAWSTGDVPELAVGTRFALEGASIAAMVHEASRPVRVDSFADAHGPIAQEAQALGIQSSVGCPIVVDGRLWGVIAASSKRATPFPPDTEAQIAEFTELVATAVANTEARSELAASRARIVAATDEERRRVVRDLHDGAQQRLVHTTVTLKLAQQALESDDESVPALVTEALGHVEQATAELRELAHGILPSVLTQGGLRAGVNALATRMPVPVQIDVAVGRLPAAVEATAYFVIAEALTNVAKHAHAARAGVAARIEDGTLRIQVRDDGAGGARMLSDGRGLVGLADRLAVLDGRLRVDSPAGGGTLVAADIPVPAGG